MRRRPANCVYRRGHGQKNTQYPCRSGRASSSAKTPESRRAYARLPSWPAVCEISKREIAIAAGHYCYYHSIAKISPCVSLHPFAAVRANREQTRRISRMFAENGCSGRDLVWPALSWTAQAQLVYEKRCLRHGSRRRKHDGEHLSQDGSLAVRRARSISCSVRARGSSTRRTPSLHHPAANFRTNGVSGTE